MEGPTYKWAGRTVYIGWLYTKTGILIGFMVLFGVFLETWEAYDEKNARGEAQTVAEGVASQLAMAAGWATEYSVGGEYSKNIPLPREIHSVPYALMIDGANFKVVVKLLGKYENENIEGPGILPESAVYRQDGSLALYAPDNFTVTEQLPGSTNGLRVTKTGGEDDYILEIEGY